MSERTLVDSLHALLSAEQRGRDVFADPFVDQDDRDVALEVTREALRVHRAACQAADAAPPWPRWLPIDAIPDDAADEYGVCLTAERVLNERGVMFSTRGGGPTHWRSADVDYVLPLDALIARLPAANIPATTAETR